ncbi:MAG: HAD family hydrolase [Candidatus Coproplasma sp.]
MKNFAFDLYGTLIKIRTDENSPGFRRKIASRFNALCGKCVDFWTEYDAAFGGAAPEEELDFIKIIKDIAKKNGVNLTDKQAESFALLFRRASTQRIGVYKGVKKTLKSLRDSGARLYILSNAQSSFTLNEIKKLGLFKYFDGIELSSDFGKKKPSKAFFLHLIKKYNLRPEDTVYTGNDFACDIITPKSLGMKCAYVHTDISPDEDDPEHVSAFADFVSEGDFSKIGEYLLSLTRQ